MSTVDELLGAEGDPIDKRSIRTSVPLFDAWPTPENSIKVRNAMKMSKFTCFCLNKTN